MNKYKNLFYHRQVSGSASLLAPAYSKWSTTQAHNIPQITLMSAWQTPKRRMVTQSRYSRPHPMNYKMSKAVYHMSTTTTHHEINQPPLPANGVVVGQTSPHNMQSLTRLATTERKRHATYAVLSVCAVSLGIPLVRYKILWSVIVFGRNNRAAFERLLAMKVSDNSYLAAASRRSREILERNNGSSGGSCCTTYTARYSAT